MLDHRVSHSACFCFLLECINQIQSDMRLLGNRMCTEMKMPSMCSRVCKASYAVSGDVDMQYATVWCQQHPLTRYGYKADKR